ncbi:outer membrane protein [Jiella marina]|uniref:outer membrane protein n=1 Tax=Jiella sp. LLJ827 TaxID=2917712 RepID=UPI0021010E58|nr:outer membrane beta-barrel protein [Jiella sp. LLJ827]MCQ0986776.1 outer membrane beta-barrel protein [Jiella sp. LLJ827]
MRLTTWIMAGTAMAAMGWSGAASAADILPPIYDAPVYQDVPEVVPVEIGTGWYLRGDVGYSFKSDAPSDFTLQFDDGTAITDLFRGSYDGLEIDAAPTFSIGAGYKFNEFLRADATVGYWTADVSDANFAAANTTIGGDVTAWEVMGNAYVDLGTYAGFTPYVGAGAGAVQVSYDNNCILAGSDCSDNFDVDLGNSDSWRFAYSLMAGLSYDVSKNLKLDVGYRYTDVDGGTRSNVTVVDTSGASLTVDGEDDGFKRHTIQAGIRYSLW